VASEYIETIIGTEEGPIALLKIMRAGGTRYDYDTDLDEPHVV
jgi:hypothetical protein